MILRIEEYVQEDGSIPYKAWFDGLDPQAAAKVATAKVRMSHGFLSNVKWFAGIGEYVIDWGPGYRIYLAKDGEALVVLFGGGTKRSQRGDIERALLLWREYKGRRAAANKRMAPGTKSSLRKR